MAVRFYQGFEALRSNVSLAGATQLSSQTQKQRVKSSGFNSLIATILPLSKGT